MHESPLSQKQAEENDSDKDVRSTQAQKARVERDARIEAINQKGNDAEERGRKWLLDLSFELKTCRNG